MKPTIGRIVLYRVGESDDQWLRNNGAQFLPAVIVKVWSDACVNLKILTDGPMDAWKTSVSFGEGEYEWRWPERT